MKLPRRSTIALVAGAALLIVASSASTAVASRMITGADIADHSITGKDLKPGAIALKHLDRTSVRAGHVHHSRKAAVVGKGATKSKVVRDSNKGTTMTNGVMTTVARVTNLPAGTYTAIGTGSLATMVVNQQNKYWPASAWCTITALGNQVAMLDMGSQPTASVPWSPTVAISRVITLTSPGDIAVNCEIFLTSPNPINNVIGFGNVDLVAFPVTSSSAG